MSNGKTFIMTKESFDYQRIWMKSSENNLILVFRVLMLHLQYFMVIFILIKAFQSIASSKSLKVETKYGPVP